MQEEKQNERYSSAFFLFVFFFWIAFRLRSILHRLHSPYFLRRFFILLLKIYFSSLSICSLIGYDTLLPRQNIVLFFFFLFVAFYFFSNEASTMGCVALPSIERKIGDSSASGRFAEEDDVLLRFAVVFIRCSMASAMFTSCM